MFIRKAVRQSSASLAHWSFVEYLVLAAFWATLSIPLIFAGWGLASILSLPLLLLSILALAWLVPVVFKPAPRPDARPKPGFPQSLEDPTLGVLPLSAHSDSRYEKTVDWCGSPVLLCLSVEGIESIGPVLRTADSLGASSAGVNTDVERFAAAELLPAVNEEPRASGNPALTPEDFSRIISLQAITVNADQSYQFLYDDGNLFGGHRIVVYGNLRQGPVEVATPG